MPFQLVSKGYRCDQRLQWGGPDVQPNRGANAAGPHRRWPTPGVRYRPRSTAIDPRHYTPKPRAEGSNPSAPAICLERFWRPMLRCMGRLGRGLRGNGSPWLAVTSPFLSWSLVAGRDGLAARLSRTDQISQVAPTTFTFTS